MPQPLRLVVSRGLSPDESVSEAQSFEGFFEAESAAMFRRLCLVTGNRHEAEEVMQDAFLNVFERWDRVRQMDDPTGYLYRIAFNVFKRRSRRAASPQPLPMRRAWDRRSRREWQCRRSPRRRPGSLRTRRIRLHAHHAWPAAR